MAACKPLCRATTAQQINHQDYEGDHEKQMNQASGYVETKPQQPKDQKNGYHCTK
jgi:hypothetical protein